MSQATDDIEVLSTALNWLKSGEQAVLVTVLKTWGSSPRPPGSLMVMNLSGKYAGSISGGCVEQQLIERLQADQLVEAYPAFINYGVDAQQASQLGLPCGGQLLLLIEQLTDELSIEKILTDLSQGKLVTRKVDTNSGTVDLLTGKVGKDIQQAESAVVKTFGPSWQLFIIGNGQIATQLARMALLLDYRVVICDPRNNYENHDPVEHVDYIKTIPDDAINQIGNLQRTAVVALAHDPRQDDLGLIAALESNAFYIGALGSKNSASNRLKRLASLGYINDQLKRIHGPVGLDIGSKKPAEIALSILAHVTAVKNGIYSG